MANIYWSEKEKAPYGDAIAALRKDIGLWYPKQFHIKVASDDGGPHLAIYIERAEPSQRMEKEISDKLPSGRFMGWRLIVIKCPIGYINSFIKV